jgi:transcriptional regulator with XRE-family HTH domain
MPTRGRRVSQILAEQLVVWRNRRGISAEQLARRIADLGGRLSRVAITEIETGRRRRISLDEALLLAAALNVPPPLLFFPFESGELVAVTPRSVIHPDLAYQWLVGDGWLAATDRTATGTLEWSEAAFSEAGTLIRLYREHRRLFTKAQDADLDVARAEYAKDNPKAFEARRRLARRLGDLVDLRNEMRKRGMKPPWLEPRWRKQLTKLGEGG